MTRLEAVQNALGAMLNAEIMHMGTIQSVTSYTHHVDLSIHFDFGTPNKTMLIKQLKQYLLKGTRLYMKFDLKQGYSVLHIEWKF